MTTAVPPSRAAPTSAKPSPPTRPSEAEERRENALASLPLFFVGGACIASAVFLYQTGDVTSFGVNGTVHLRPWLLFIALGITGLSGGIVTLFSVDEVAAPQMAANPTPAVTAALPRPSKALAAAPSVAPKGRYPGPTSEELALLSDRVNAAEAPSPAVAPRAPSPSAPRPSVAAGVWDETSTSPTAPSSRRREEWDESPEDFEAAASPPAPPDVVLRQLDDLEVSLRKKPTSTRSG